MHRIFIKKCLLFTVGTVWSREAVHNWVEKFSQGLSKVTDDAQPGHPVEISTEATVLRVGELIRADRWITTDSVATKAVENSCSNMWHTI
jgi:hypothetical protein